MGTARQHQGSSGDVPSGAAPAAFDPTGGRSNTAIARQLSAHQAAVAFRATVPRLARQDKPDAATRLRKLEAESMEQIIKLIGEMDATEHDELANAAPGAPPRVKLAFKAWGAKGTAAATFGIANSEALAGLGGMDQRNAILKLVDPKFKPPPQLELGDKIMGGKAIVHAQHVRVRKGNALTWQAYNPGAIGSEPSGFKCENHGSYGKTIGPAAIAIFPDESTGIEALHAWIQYKANKGATFQSFFKSHAPAPKKPGDPGYKPDDPANKGNAGNDPAKYAKEVADRMGDPKAVGKSLKDVDIGKLAGAIQTQEGWGQGGEQYGWEDEAIPEKDRFALLYSEWANPEFGMPPGRAGDLRRHQSATSSC